MAFGVRSSVRTAGDKTGEVLELINSEETVRAEVWPQRGFNCLRWQLMDESGRLADLLHVADDWEVNPVPTRSGHPILFPFPGRLRNGEFTFAGTHYALPLNDSIRKHAIHGFTPRNSWRVIDSSTGPDSATVTGEFTLEKDLPEALALWPADFVLAITYTLTRDRLRVEARIENHGPGSLPFGLGYHPYFHLPGAPESSIARHVLWADVNEVWDSIELLPTGSRSPIPRQIDFHQAKAIGTVELDHVFRRRLPAADSPDHLVPLAELSHPDVAGRLRILADTVFRELVLFTPPHRQAVAIEPYTCSADAANLAGRGIDSGWIVIPAGGTWEAAVEYFWIADSASVSP